MSRRSWGPVEPLIVTVRGWRTVRLDSIVDCHLLAHPHSGVASVQSRVRVDEARRTATQRKQLPTIRHALQHFTGRADNGKQPCNPVFSGGNHHQKGPVEISHSMRVAKSVKTTTTPRLAKTPHSAAHPATILCTCSRTASVANWGRLVHALSWWDDLFQLGLGVTCMNVLDTKVIFVFIRSSALQIARDTSADRANHHHCPDPSSGRRKNLALADAVKARSHACPSPNPAS